MTRHETSFDSAVTDVQEENRSHDGEVHSIESLDEEYDHSMELPHDSFYKRLWQKQTLTSLMVLTTILLVTVAVVLPLASNKEKINVPQETFAPSLSPVSFANPDFLFSLCADDQDQFDQNLILDESIRRSHAAYLRLFHFDWNIEVCTPENLSLLALAAATASVHRSRPASFGTGEATTAKNKYSLGAFFFATQGPTHWIEKSNWLAHDDVCQWYGVECFENLPRALGLRENGINGTLPNALQHLKYFEVLDLSKNALHGTLPSDLLGAELLKINLSANYLTGSLPIEWFNSTNNALDVLEDGTAAHDVRLESLIIEFNSLHGTIPTEIGLMTSLEELDLHSNILTGTIPTEIGNLQMLRALLLAFNVFDGTLATEIGKCTNLGALDLYNNELSGDLPTELGLLAKLSRLNLKANLKLKGNLPTELGYLTDLSSLSFADNYGMTGTVPIEICTLVWNHSLVEFGDFVKAGDLCEGRYGGLICPAEYDGCCDECEYGCSQPLGSLVLPGCEDNQLLQNGGSRV